MTDKNGNLYEFGAFVIDTRQNTLFLDGAPVRIPAKTFETLLYLVERNNQIVGKEELIASLWPDSFVEEANLSVHISNLRKALAADPASSVSIETFPKVGYRFNADVKVNKNGAWSLPLADDGDSDRSFNGRSSVHQKKRPLAVSAAMILGFIVFASAAGYLAVRFFGLPGSKAMTMTRVPGTEHSSSIALSPSGEFLAHAVSVGGKRTLMMTSINSASSVPLLPPDDADYWGMTFTRDNGFLYFIKSGPEFNTLYKIPILGGDVTKILDQPGNRIDFSPDGSRFCFVRKLPGEITALLTAAADGTDEVEIARRTPPEYYASSDISWSPDGTLIAVGAGTQGNNPKSQIVAVRVDGGEESAITEKRWAGIDGVEWLNDGTGLVAGMFEGPTSTTHVWLVPYPLGEPVKITSDLENYGTVGLSADDKTLMVGQFKDNTSVWVVPGGGADQAQPARTGKHHRFQWVRWMPDGGFIFASDAGRNRDVWRMNLDGSGERQLTDGPDANVMPVATADGRYVVFSAFRDNNGLFELFRMDADGSNQVRLTQGGGAWQPALSPDGKWAFYTSGKNNGPMMQRRIWKVPVEGGGAGLFWEGAAFYPTVSPDGRFVACLTRSDEKAKLQVAIISIEGGQPVKLLDISPTERIDSVRIDWTPDSKAISYIRTVNDVSNIWTQPIDEGPPKQETSFTSETITNFDWSSDNRLLLSRFIKTRDVVLIRNFR